MRVFPRNLFNEVEKMPKGILTAVVRSLSDVVV